MNEIWKDIQGYEGLYQVSNFGRVKSLDRMAKCRGGVYKLNKERIVFGGIGKYGYNTVCLRKENKRKYLLSHRLVAINFIPNPENKPKVNHINGVKTDNSIENLEWCTVSENTKHGFDVLGRKMKKGYEDKRSKSVMQVSLDGFLQNIFGSINEAANTLGFHSGTIYGCLSGRAKKAFGYKWYYENEPSLLTN